MTPVSLPRESLTFCYPKRFEFHRLEALRSHPDDDLYHDVQHAQQRYDQGHGVIVVPDVSPPSWSMKVSPDRHRYSLTFYNAQKTPLREAKWERVDGALFCRQIIDLFYPDGDPCRRVPFINVVTVTRDFSTDGVLGVTLSSPIADDDFREVTNVSIDGLRVPLPSFGDWAPIIEASAPDEVDRFSVDAIDAAIRLANQAVAAGDVIQGFSPETGGWRVPNGDKGVLAALNAVINGREVDADMAVITRGAASVLPLALQAGRRDSGRDPREEEHRMRTLAESVRGACEYHEGQQITFDLERRSRDRLASYARALRSAGATSAVWWVFAPQRAVVLVWTGAAAAGDLALALHVVPASWVVDRHVKAEIDGIDVMWTAADLADALGAS